MQIKRFEAQSMTHALDLIKKEFGSDAVILSARTLKKEKGVIGFLRRPRVEVTAATDSHPVQPNNCNSSNRLWDTTGLQTHLSPGAGLSTKKAMSNSFANGIASESRGSTSCSSYLPPEEHPNILTQFYQQMLSQGLKEDIARELTTALNFFASSKKVFTLLDLKQELVGILNKRGISAKRVKIERGKQKIIAFIGTTGVGKTTTIAKFAAAAQVRNRNIRVALITLDNDRIASIEPLDTYARIIGLPMEIVSNQKEIKQVIKKFKNQDLILIDTPGLTKSNKNKIMELKRLFSKIPSLEIHLLLNATSREDVHLETLQMFRPLPFTRLMFTKLDEIGTYGNILNLIFQTKMPLSYFTNSQEVPEGIETAKLEKLVDLLLGREKEESRLLRIGRRMLRDKSRYLHSDHTKVKNAYHAIKE